MKKYAIRKDFSKYRMFTKFPLPKKLIKVANAALLLMIPKSDSEVIIKKKIINDCEGGKFKILIYEPRDIEEKAPCLVYYHGGAFALEAAPYHYKLAKEYAIRGKCKVIFVMYRLAPKYMYPIPLKDCFTAYNWVVKNAEKLKIDSKRIAIGGDSAGGNLASAVALMVREKMKTQPCFLMIVYPVIDRRMQTKSMKEYDDTPLWYNSINQKMWEYYLGGKPIDDIGYASPIEAESLKGLPNTYVETAEFDCLHDEGVEFAKALKNAGVQVELNETKGTIHGFDIELKSDYVKACIDRRISVLKAAFKSAH